MSRVGSRAEKARLGDDTRGQGYGAIDPETGGRFNARASGARFNDMQTKLSKSIFNIGRQTNSLREMHRQLSRGQGNEQLVQQLEHKLMEVTGMCKEAGNSFIMLAAIARESAEREKQLIATSLRSDFERAFSNFSSVQKDVIQLLKAMPVQQPADDRNPFQEDDDAKYVEQDDDEHQRLIKRDQEREYQRQRRQRQQQEQMLVEDTALAQERLKEMRQLESDVVEINNLMKDIMDMVIKQGDDIDTIEAHVEVTETRARKGRIELGKAKALQQSNRRLCCCIVCICIIILLALAITGGVVAAIVKGSK